MLSRKWLTIIVLAFVLVGTLTGFFLFQNRETAIVSPAGENSTSPSPTVGATPSLEESPTPQESEEIIQEEEVIE